MLTGTRPFPTGMGAAVHLLPAAAFTSTMNSGVYVAYIEPYANQVDNQQVAVGTLATPHGRRPGRCARGRHRACNWCRQHSSRCRLRPRLMIFIWPKERAAAQPRRRCFFIAAGSRYAMAADQQLPAGRRARVSTARLFGLMRVVSVPDLGLAATSGWARARRRAGRHVSLPRRAAEAMRRSFDWLGYRGSRRSSGASYVASWRRRRHGRRRSQAAAAAG